MNDGSVSATPADAQAIPVDGRPVEPRSIWWSAARRRAMELLIVFVGVYAAFVLNRLDSDRRDTKRRLQILDALEREVSTSARELGDDITQADGAFSDFDRRLAAGEMPRIGISFTDSGYSASDDAALLQAGGLELLDIQTVEQIREVNNLERSLLSFIHDQFELALAELANHEPEDFYDQATHQLKKRYAWYPRIQHSTLSQARVLQAAEEKLLTHLRSIQHPGATPSPRTASPAPSPAGRTTPSHTPAASTPAA